MSQYEVHVTVEDFPSLREASDFADYASGLDCKPLLIELDKGVHPLQLMLGQKQHFANDNEAFRWAETLAHRVVIDGWNVRRLKLETVMDTPSRAQYWEAHYKFDIRANGRYDLADFTRLSVLRGWLQSRNFFDRRVHYLSLRHYPDTLKTDAGVLGQVQNGWLAASCFKTGREKISEAGLPLKSAHFETVLYDSSPQYDKGWDD